MGTSWSAASPPFFRVLLDGGSHTIEGSPRADLGHRIERADERAGGNWAGWRWDGSELTASNDRYRAYPLFYSATPTSMAISTSVDSLLAAGADRQLDLDALAVFLMVGFYPGEDTPFAAIRALPPSASLSWRRGELSLTSERPSRPATGGSREETVRHAAELVRAAVQRSIPDDPDYIMPISGGRDSRHLLYELIHAGHPPARAVTAHHHPNVWGGDVPYARRLCRELGIEHEVVTPGPLIADEWRKDRRTSYGADEHAWYLAVGDALDERTSHTYDGLNGSTALARDYYPPKLARLDAEGRLGDAARSVGRRQKRQPRHLPLLAPHRREQLGAAAAAARIEVELRRYADAPYPYLAHRFWDRTVRELNLTSTLLLPGVPAAYTPFMDPEFVEFAWTIPSEYIDDTYHDEVIGVYFPEANEIPYRESTYPKPTRAWLREMNRDLLSLLRQQSDGSLVDRRRLMRRAAWGAVVGDDWFAWGRRAALTTYLIQLEAISAGRGPGDLA